MPRSNPIVNRCAAFHNAPREIADHADVQPQAFSFYNAPDTKKEPNLDKIDRVY
jgi:hypothetical protein